MYVGAGKLFCLRGRKSTKHGVCCSEFSKEIATSDAFGSNTHASIDIVSLSAISVSIMM